jgi:hypothetical protein
LLDLACLISSRELRYSTNHDFALIRVEQLDPTNRDRGTLLTGISVSPVTPANTGTGPSSFDYSANTKPFQETGVGSDVFLFGFPSSLGLPQMPQIDPNLPLLRKGIVAGKNLKRRVLILDCPSYQGNSGGPVVTRETTSAYTKYIVLGVVTEWIPFSESWLNSRFPYNNTTLSNSGYSIAEPIDLAIQMFWN